MSQIGPAEKVFVDRPKDASRDGTACTVYVKRSAKRLPSTINQMLQEFRKDGLNAPLNAFNILEITENSNARRLSHTVHRVLKYRLKSPDVDITFYPHRDDSAIQRPPPVFELECGPEHITLQYLLERLTSPRPGMTIMPRLINEWLHQLGLDATPELQKKIGLEQVMVWVGDQLTVDRLRNLARFRAEDDNSFERLDWLVSPPGWLHICMAFANSIHKQHIGSRTSKGRGLSAAFSALGRKGLEKTKTQGPFFHDLDETLHIIAEAQFRNPPLQTGRKDCFEHASSTALAMNRAKKQVDELKEQSIMFLRDVLPYILLRTVIKHGRCWINGGFNSRDVVPLRGRKQLKVPHREMLELLQGLNRNGHLSFVTSYEVIVR
ncbi:hypothetical protein R3P38DRAFT_3482943 [Favolaschia claudopus]|uniref:DUF6589 domain-containing protein n=1 Tax=Favolaschia claudopus TaxID=2862362 RepID=A0AAV9Z7A5_9AGAR